MKGIKPDWSFNEIFLSGLVTAIAINYLLTGFVDIVLNINSLLNWLQQPNSVDTITQLAKELFRP